jgi:hypothetical protein
MRVQKRLIQYDFVPGFLLSQRFSMNAFIKSTLISSFIGLFIVAGCGESDNPAGSQTTAVGTWNATVSGATMTILVNADSTFTMEVPGTNGTIGTYTKSGACTLSGNTIIFNSTSCTLDGLGVPCMSPDTGTISGTQMTLPIPYGDGTAAILTKK